MFTICDRAHHNNRARKKSNVIELNEEQFQENI